MTPFHREAVWILVPVAMQMMGAETVRGQGARTEPDDVRVRSIMAMIASTEQTFAAVEWSQTAYVPPTATYQRKEWVLGTQQDRYVSDGGTWGIREVGHYWDPEDKVDTIQSGFYLGAAGFRVTYGVAEKRGMLTTLDGYHASGANMWRAMGQSLDLDHPLYPQSLSSLLYQAKRLEYIEPTPDYPWPGVRAFGISQKFMADAEVYVDPSHGGIIRRVRDRRPHDQVFVRDLIVLDVQNLDGIWVPRTFGTLLRAVYPVDDLEHPFSEQIAKDVETAMTMKGLPQECQSDLTLRWLRESVASQVVDKERRHVSGPGTALAKGKDASLFTPQIGVVTSIRFLDRAPTEAWIAELPEDFPFASALDDTRHSAQETAEAATKIIIDSTADWLPASHDNAHGGGIQ
ncbi:MAG: hypothetical protein IT432_16910 [Phycisphaerales bacterium]|nr:hypothetical protein [Phycisphaerales bacterium]